MHENQNTGIRIVVFCHLFIFNHILSPRFFKQYSSRRLTTVNETKTSFHQIDDGRNSGIITTNPHYFENIWINEILDLRFLTKPDKNVYLLTICKEKIIENKILFSLNNRVNSSTKSCYKYCKS